MEITTRIFGTMPDGRKVMEYTLANKNSITVKLINYGGVIRCLMVPGKDGVQEDIVLGFDTLEEYLNDNACFGALVGRYANRIAKNAFKLDNKLYNLRSGNEFFCLHGGIKGFDKVFWDITPLDSKEGNGLQLSYFSKDGDEGFPGNLKVLVFYILTNNNELKIKYEAVSDKKTVINLTQHSYFNLSAGRATDCLSHSLKIDADKYLPTDDKQIPMGIEANVENSPFDFRTTKPLGKDIDNDDIQLKTGKGYDHSWVLRSGVSPKPELAAILEDALSGRRLDIYTTEPGLQIYTGNHISRLKGKNGMVYGHRYGVALETQHFPDSPNQAQFPTTELEANDKFTSETILKFGVLE